MPLRTRHLLGIEHLDKDEIETILDTADSFKEVLSREIKKVPTLRGKTVVTLFYEPSTRTRTSFEMAAKILSADTVSIATTTSSVQKGETLVDTVRNLEAMMPDCVIVRHPCAGVPDMLSRICRGSVINAGDGAHEHPTQALLDAMTMREKKGRIQGLRVAIVGDIRHSRVARSNIHLLKKLGADVNVAGPSTLIPPDIDKLGAGVTTEPIKAIRDADVVMMLRIQQERMDKSFFPTLREFAMLYGLTREKMKHARPDAIIMHPGPMNRGVEIDHELADSNASVILDQVQNGVAVRMAVLYLLVGGNPAQGPSTGGPS
ncbi:MAG: aspartate carbamoyltransferase catalytic subunit [Acidobacteriota bacterium]